MTQALKPYTAPALQDWGKVVELTMQAGVSAFGGDSKPKCNQGLGNGSEGCDPGNSNHNQPSNDEPGGGRGKGNPHK
ncbi:hypothetical protein K9N68_00630 [Kovacikia minuta CCNUW1]|uniref:hypothetical protein n=1 Tax=Kovacikia minuta TaxID=2931930 RepID=UPI001CC90A53|nr:hypothetical protein [Kovacikia minuta]UBF26554.1 hypothetical protein K9N68_00630 [Kovacikia minuta CCNUW1]